MFLVMGNGKKCWASVSVSCPMMYSVFCWTPQRKLQRESNCRRIIKRFDKAGFGMKKLCRRKQFFLALCWLRRQGITKIAVWTKQPFLILSKNQLSQSCNSEAKRRLDAGCAV